MKIIAVLLAIVALISSSVALKNDVCGLPHSVNGNGVMACMAFNKSWSYKADTNECVEFVYGGCMGNDNRFPTQEICEEKCKE